MATPDSVTRPRDRLGYRAKLAILIPASNTICEPECDALMPHGVTNRFSRMTNVPRGAGGDMEAYRKSLQHDTSFIKEAITAVSPSRPDMILLGHSIDTFRGGVKGANEMKADLDAHAKGPPVILPSHALLAALKAMGIKPGEGKRISFLTPYWPPGDDQVGQFFEAAGYKVGRIIGLKCPDPLAIAEVTEETIVDALRELAAEHPDMIIEPGTNMASGDLTAAAITWLRVPAVSSNTATYWHALRSLGIQDKFPGHGPLFQFH